ncbi:hypothetical protein J6590_062300 [Homalodisca vitripennis]|nr:hypothetical protein J6590_062300 [Homalodisca vitripennis]
MYAPTYNFESRTCSFVGLCSFRSLEVLGAWKLLPCDFRTTANGWECGLLSRKRSLCGHPSKQQPRPTLLDPEKVCYPAE